MSGELALPKLSARQRRAIPLVLTSPTLEAGLKAAGIAKSTWWNWKGQQAFLRAVEAAEDASYAESLQRAKAAHLRAVDKISELIDHKDPRIALQASQALMAYSLKIVELIDVRRDIREVRARLDELGAK
jgi:hypothetical protein